jgi:DNA-binding response OmpR family regulator
LSSGQLQRSVETALISAHFHIHTAGSAKECAQLVRSEKFDGIVVECHSLPFEDVLCLMAFLRMENPRVAIGVIAQSLDLQQRLHLFAAGVDDLILAPFYTAELTVRLRRTIQLRQAAADFAAAHEVSLLRCGDLEVDLVRRKAMRSGKLIEYLARNVNRPVTRTMILEHVWGSSFEGLTNVVDVYINSIRNKLDRAFPRKLIQTYRGIGYSLVSPSLLPHAINNDEGAPE